MILSDIEEQWEIIPKFSDYKVSDLGRVYSIRRDHIMNHSYTLFGHAKITLVSRRTGTRHTVSIARLVSEAFVEPPNGLCDYIVVLDGNRPNVAAYNLVWRPRWFAWKYTHQWKQDHPDFYYNVPVVNTSTGNKYNSVIEAGMTEGLLFDDIWRSTVTLAAIFPYRSIFEVC